MSKLDIFLDLMQIVESAFVYKLKKKNPNISEDEVKSKIREWYLDQPMISPSNCIQADVSRFL